MSRYRISNLPFTSSAYSFNRGVSGGGGLPTMLDYGTPTAVWQAEDLSATPVTTWTDATSNGYDGIASSTGPAYSSTGFDGTHGVVCSSASTANRLIFTTLSGLSAWTIVAFIRYDVDSNILGHTSATSQIRRHFSGANNLLSYFGTVRQSNTTSPVLYSDVHMAVWEFDGTDCLFRCNEVELTGAAGSPGTFALSHIFSPGYNADMFQGEIGMLGIWPTDLGKTITDQIYTEVGQPRYPSLP